MNVYALCGGYIDLDRSGFFCDVAPGTRVTVPVMCFLIAHPRGNLLLELFRATGIEMPVRSTDLPETPPPGVRLVMPPAATL